MADELLYSQSEALILVTLLVLLGVGAEVGYRLGYRCQSRTDESAKSHIRSIQAAVLALLGLLLGFTLAASISRLDQRKQAVLHEANAIGTAALRAQLLPALVKAEATSLFRQYVDIRLESSRRSWDQGVRNEFDRKATHIQERLWDQAAAVGQKEPQNFTTGLFIQALNEMIDSKAARDAALDNHVPETVLFLLFYAAVSAIGMVGYVNGLTSKRLSVLTGLLLILIGLTIAVIVDLDRPRRGLISVSQKSMIELKKGLDMMR